MHLTISFLADPLNKLLVLAETNEMIKDGD
jgi:hypothetical protein